MLRLEATDLPFAVSHSIVRNLGTLMPPPLHFATALGLGPQLLPPTFVAIMLLLWQRGCRLRAATSSRCPCARVAVLRLSAPAIAPARHRRGTVQQATWAPGPRVGVRACDLHRLLVSWKRSEPVAPAHETERDVAVACKIAIVECCLGFKSQRTVECSRVPRRIRNGRRVSYQHERISRQANGRPLRLGAPYRSHQYDYISGEFYDDMRSVV